MHFGPALLTLRKETPLSTGQPLRTEGLFARPAAAVAVQESRPQGDSTDAGLPMVGPHA